MNNNDNQVNPINSVDVKNQDNQPNSINPVDVKNQDNPVNLINQEKFECKCLGSNKCECVKYVINYFIEKDKINEIRHQKNKELDTVFIQFFSALTPILQQVFPAMLQDIQGHQQQQRGLPIDIAALQGLLPHNNGEGGEPNHEDQEDEENHN